MSTVNPDRPDIARAVNERVAAGLADKDARPADPQRDVLNTLLGRDKLTAADMSGGDPYNATGRFFRR